jgi:hypothetical protein
LRLRLLAVTSDTRLTQFPQTPTVAESGVPGYEYRGWVVVMAPAVAAARDEHAPARLADVCAVAERRLAPDGALWLVAAYDALDEGAGAPAQLRRLLAAHKFDCVALIPVEAEGEHVLAARCRPQGLAMRLPLSA